MKYNLAGLESPSSRLIYLSLLLCTLPSSTIDTDKSFCSYSFVICYVWKFRSITNLALFLDLPIFFVLWFVFTILHGRGSASVYYAERKLKNKKWGEAWERDYYQQLIIPLASFPGPAQLSVACMQYGKSDGKLGGAWERAPGPVKLHNNSPLPTHTLTRTHCRTEGVWYPSWAGNSLQSQVRTASSSHVHQWCWEQEI